MAQQKKTDTFFEAYERLNTAQKQAVDAIEGPVMVIAGPGTGKTQILTLRIAKILRETHAEPENILALTFTNSGVRAMRERLRLYIGDDAYRVGIYTFHSFAEQVLQTYRSYFPSFGSAQVVTDLEKAQMLESILDGHDFVKIVSTYDPYSSLRQVMDAVSNIKQEGFDPDAFEALIPAWEEAQLQSEEMFYKRATGTYKPGDVKPTEKQKVTDRVMRAREVATVFREYQRMLQGAQRYDFSDMILSVLDELSRNENLKLDLQELYQYVLVDEHQDTNEGQNKLIELLTDAEHLDGRPNLFTVGDEKQSIYRFQGASDKAFQHFKDHYNDVLVIELEENYRSNAPILEASHGLITHSLPSAKSLRTNVSDTTRVSIREFSDYKFELLFIAEEIASKIASGVPADEIAVIYRSNKHLMEIKSLFEEFEVPYHVLSRDTLLDDPLIQTFITLMRVIADPYDDAALGKLLFAEFLHLDAIMVADTLRHYRSEKRMNRSKGLIDVIALDERYQSVMHTISSLKTYSMNHHFIDTLREALHQSGFLAHVLNQRDSRGALRKVEVLFNEVRQQAERGLSYTVFDFITFIDATLKYNLPIEVTAVRVGKGVQCMTAHGSKGLEFEHVYIMNTARSNWEKSRSFPGITLPLERYSGDLDDERRLFYVAVTRAKQSLSISSSKRDWSGRAMEPSQFISELGDDAIQRESVESFELAHEGDLITFFSNKGVSSSVFDTKYLADRFGEETLSVTALNNYIECPRKYLFRNLIQLPDVYTPALRYGDTVHGALEDFFAASASAHKVLSRDTLLDAYEKRMQASGFSGKEYDTFLLKGRRSLGMYYDYYHAHWSTEILLEKYVRRTTSVLGNDITLSGKIDKIEFLETPGKGRVRVVDYKTGKPFSKKSTKLQKDALLRQIHFYHLLLEGYADGDIVVTEAVLDFVEPTDEDTFEQKTVPVTNEELTALRKELEQMVGEVLDGSFLARGCNKKECEWCTFWDTLAH